MNPSAAGRALTAAALTLALVSIAAAGALIWASTHQPIPTRTVYIQSPGVAVNA